MENLKENVSHNKSSRIHAPFRAFGNSFGKGRLAGSLKLKLVSGFIAIGVVTGVVSIVSSFILGASINKLDRMVETTVLANGITNRLNELTDVQGALTQYVTMKDAESLHKIRTNKQLAADNVSALKKLIVDKQALSKLIEAEQQIKTCSEFIDSAVKAAQDQDAVKAAQDKDEAVKIIGFIKVAVEEFIASELNYQEIKKAELKRQAAFTNLLLIVVIIVVTFLSIFIASIYTGKIASTINKLAHNARIISEGDLKISEITIDSNDDISVLAKAFNKMGESLRTLISRINKSSEEVAGSAELLKLSVDQSTHTIQMIATTIEQVSSGAHNQSEQSKETGTVIDQLLEGNKRVYDNAQDVLLTSDEAMHAAENGRQKLKLLLSQIQVIEEKIASTQSITEMLNKRSGEIKLILDTITSISSQTNLLALNAAIEAARAGEHGKGFAVVADEIRKLAVGSADAASEITDMLKEIQLRSKQAAESMRLGVSEVKSGIEIAGIASEAFEKIVNTSENVDLKVKKINSEIESMVKDIKRVKEVSSSISGIAEQFSSGSQEVAAAVEEQMASLQEISTSASVLSEMASGLEDMVSRFKL